MPSLFDSHQEFSEWFAKDIESHAENRTSLDQHQLSRLHMILKPFMLRRIKKDVENELGDKIEKEIRCPLTYRQKHMYQRVKEKISRVELLEKSMHMSEANVAHLMNLVMQLRKVCNHPELFERRDAASPLQLSISAPMYSQREFQQTNLIPVHYYNRSHIELHVPKIVYHTCKYHYKHMGEILA